MGVAFGAAYTSLGYYQQQHEQAVAAQRNAASNQQRPEQGATDHAGVPGFAQRYISNPEPTDQTERENRDLAAQENTAAWAFWVALFSGMQFLLSAVGLWALLTTIRQGRAGLEQAREGNLLAEDTARRQLAAYIGTNRAYALYPKGPKGRIILELQNFGQTPAFDVVVYHHLAVKSYVAGEAKLQTILIGYDLGIVEPGSKPIIQIAIPDKFFSDFWSEIEAGSQTLFLNVAIQFRDIYNQERSRQFTYYLKQLQQTSRDSAIPLNISSWENTAT